LYLQSNSTTSECQDPNTILEQHVQILKDSLVQNKQPHFPSFKGKNSLSSFLGVKTHSSNEMSKLLKHEKKKGY
jgi:hypothetical protein